MKRLKFTKAILILVCTASLAGCGNIQKDTGTDAPSYSQNSDGDQPTDTSNEAQALLDSAALVGSVTDFRREVFRLWLTRPKITDRQQLGSTRHGK